MTPKSRENDLITQNVNDELFIYDLKIDKVYSLNETSAFIWNNLDGKTSVGDLARKLSQQVNQPVNDDFIWLAIDELQKVNLLEDANLPKAMSKIKRREAIKRIGLASMIVLPVIASLTAPTAINAQSGGNGAITSPCTTPGQCANTSLPVGDPNSTCCRVYLFSNPTAQGTCARRNEPLASYGPCLP